MLDTDGDGVLDLKDNCPYTANGPLLGTCLGNQVPATCHANSDCASGVCSLNQEDTGGVGVGSPPDGIEDACQCGDVNDDGTVNSTDSVVYGRALVGLSPYFTTGAMPDNAKCDVSGDGLCNTADNTIIARALVGLFPWIIQQTCTAAICHAPEVCPP